VKTISVGLAAAVLLLAGAASAALDEPGPKPERFLVGFAQTPGTAERAAVVRHGGEVVRALPSADALAVAMAPAAAGALTREVSVRYVEPDRLRYPLDLSSSQLTPSPSNGLYGLITTRAVDAHALGRTGDGVKACVADTGIDAAHPDIAANFHEGRSFVQGEPPGNVRGAADETHGTHVAGTVLAVNNSVGVIGVAYDAELYYARVLRNDGGWSSDIMAGVEWLVTQKGCRIVNMSLGGSFGSKTEESFYASMRNTHGALIVAASGNDGARQISYPARYPDTIAVGAVDRNDQHASFSNTGNGLDFVAPGVAVLSAVPDGLGYETSVAVAGQGYAASALEYAGTTDADGISGPLVDCARALSPANCTGQPPTGPWVALIERGDISFADKVLNATAAGAAAAIIYNNVTGSFQGTLGEPGNWIPAVSISRADGLSLKTQLGSTATVVNLASSWDHYDGTSMATPHVTGVMALVWSTNPSLSANVVQDILTATARDLGATGWDRTYGHGIVDALAAVQQAAPPPVAPGAPTGVTATAGDASATVSWTPPASNGGSGITGYVVTPYVGGTAQPATAVGAVTSTTVTGLTNGTSYTFRVAAVNAVGTGPQSDPSNAVTPSAPVDDGNLLANGSFASSAAGWAGWNASLSRLEQGREGPGALRVSLAAAAAGYAVFTSPRPVTATTAGNAYTATGWTRSDTPGRRVCLALREWSAAGAVVAVQRSCLTASGSWQQFPELPYITQQSGGQLELFVDQGGAQTGDSFDLDDLHLAAASG
jgi:subtilisin family serine protease